MLERITITNAGADFPNVERLPFMNVDNYQGPYKAELAAWALKYNRSVAESNRQFVALNTEQAQPQTQGQEEARHVGAGSFDPVTKAWIDDIMPEVNAEAEVHGAGEYDPFTKKWK